MKKKDEVTNIIEFTGYTSQGDDVIEWHDEDADVKLDMHRVDINRDARGLAGIAFNFSTKLSAHAAFLALCDASSVYVDGDFKDNSK